MIRVWAASGRGGCHGVIRLERLANLLGVLIRNAVAGADTLEVNAENLGGSPHLAGVHAKPQTELSDGGGH